MKDPAQNTLMRYAYAYDAAGNITVKNTEHGNYAYGYDIVDRLTSATYPTAQEAFVYDKVGNRIKHNSGSPWAYNANNELTSRPAISYQYDANGSQIKKTEGTTVTDYIYDGSNRLNKVKQGATTIASYAYDPFGRRISKTVNGTTTYYYYSDEGLAAEADNTGAITQTYGYAPNSTWGTDPIYTKAGGSYHYYLNDHLGTPQQLAQKNGAKTWSAVYKAFGKATITTSTIANNLRFPGQYADSETGLHYNWNRTYDNQTGRYIKADPIGINGGMNVFGYVNAAPTTVTDPKGLVEWTGVGSGLSAARAIGAGVYLFRLRSSCVNNKRARVIVLATAGGIGFSFSAVKTPATGTASSLILDDRSSTLSPNNLNGFFLAYVAGVTVGSLDGSISFVNLGKARNKKFDGAGMSTDILSAGFSVMLGGSMVLSSEVTKCGCK